MNRRIEVMVRSEFNIPQDYTVTLGARKPSQIGGYDSLPVTLSRGEKTQVVNFLLSTDGKTLAQPLAQSKLFPQLMIDLVRIGEETGDVPGALNNIADTYENELQIALRVMSDLIGPVLIIVMALVVGFLLLSIFLPLFRLIAAIH